MDINNPHHPRYNTNKVLQMVDAEELCKDTVLQMALEYLSDDDVYQMCLRNDIFLNPEDEE